MGFILRCRLARSWSQGGADFQRPPAPVQRAVAHWRGDGDVPAASHSGEPLPFPGLTRHWAVRPGHLTAPETHQAAAISGRGARLLPSRRSSISSPIAPAIFWGVGHAMTPNMFSLSGQTALVTGGTRGI